MEQGLITQKHKTKFYDRLIKVCITRHEYKYLLLQKSILIAILIYALVKIRTDRKGRNDKGSITTHTFLLQIVSKTIYS